MKKGKQMKNMLTQKEINALLGVKECTICHETKSLSEFHKRARMKDGHRSECKECKSIADAKRKEPKPTSISYPESLVMHTLENESWSLFDKSLLVFVPVLLVAGIWLYLTMGGN